MCTTGAPPLMIRYIATRLQGTPGNVTRGRETGQREIRRKRSATMHQSSSYPGTCKVLSVFVKTCNSGAFISCGYISAQPGLWDKNLGWNAAWQPITQCCIEHAPKATSFSRSFTPRLPYTVAKIRYPGR